MSRRKVLLVIRGENLFSPQDDFAGQEWERNSFLIPLPPFLISNCGIIIWHYRARKLRDWWPFWWQIPFGGGPARITLARKSAKFIFGWGLDLINKEIQNTTEVIWKKK